MYRDSLAAGIDKLGRLATTIGELRRVPRLTAVKAQTWIAEQLLIEYREGQDPYGRPWAPLRPATLAIHGPPPLTRSGMLRVDTAVRLLEGARNGLMLEAGRDYAYFHQVGFRHRGGKDVPARKIFPDRGMPRRWREILERAAKEAIAEIRGHK